MRYSILILLFACIAKSDVNYVTAPIERKAKITIQKTVGRRDGSVVHQILLFSSAAEPQLVNSVETFYIDGKPVLSLSRVKGSCTIASHDLGGGYLEIYYKSEGGGASFVAVGKNRESAEVFLPGGGGLHVAADDADRRKWIQDVGFQKPLDKTIPPSCRVSTRWSHN